ncbi:MAG: histidine phosphatase family protein [Pleurocapsa sp.]
MSNLLSPIESIPITAGAASTQQATKVILVRHARTTYNQQGRYQGSSDTSVLTEQGQLDAYTTGLALQQFDFDALYTSPLTRVQQTTSAIISAWNQKIPPVIVEPRLTEVCMSDWQGLYYHEVKEHFAEAYSCWQNTPQLFSRDGVFFPVLELFNQAQSFWRSLLARHRSQTILVVAHGGTNRALIATAIGLSPSHYHSLQQSNCGITCLTFKAGTAGHHQPKLNYLNVTNHLDEKLPKLKAGKTGWRWLLLSNSTAQDLLHRSYLPELMAQNKIDLVLTDNSQRGENLAHNLATAHQQTVHFAISQERFLETWQQRISQRQRANSAVGSASLTTGLIIAGDHLLQPIFSKTLAVDPVVNLAGYLSVIHYPHANCQSILQGVIPLEQQFISQLS